MFSPTPISKADYESAMQLALFNSYADQRKGSEPAAGAQDTSQPTLREIAWRQYVRDKTKMDISQPAAGAQDASRPTQLLKRLVVRDVSADWLSHSRGAIGSYIAHELPPSKLPPLLLAAKVDECNRKIAYRQYVREKAQMGISQPATGAQNASAPALPPELFAAKMDQVRRGLLWTLSKEEAQSDIAQPPAAAAQDASRTTYPLKQDFLHAYQAFCLNDKFSRIKSPPNAPTSVEAESSSSRERTLAKLIAEDPVLKDPDSIYETEAEFAARQARKGLAAPAASQALSSQRETNPVAPEEGALAGPSSTSTIAAESAISQRAAEQLDGGDVDDKADFVLEDLEELEDLADIFGTAGCTIEAAVIAAVVDAEASLRAEVANLAAQFQRLAIEQ